MSCGSHNCKKGEQICIFNLQKLDERLARRSLNEIVLLKSIIQRRTFLLILRGKLTRRSKKGSKNRKLWRICLKSGRT